MKGGKIMDAIKKLNPHGTLVVSRIEREQPWPTVLYRLTAYASGKSDEDITIVMTSSDAIALALFIVDEENKKNAQKA